MSTGTDQSEWEVPVFAALEKWDTALGESFDVPWKKPLPPKLKRATKELVAIIESTLGDTVAEPFITVCDRLAELHGRAAGGPTADQAKELKSLLFQCQFAIPAWIVRTGVAAANKRLGEAGVPVPRKIEDWQKLGKSLTIPSLDSKTAADVFVEVERFLDDEQWHRWQKRIDTVRGRASVVQTEFLGIAIDHDSRILIRGDSQTSEIPAKLQWPVLLKLIDSGNTGLSSQKLSELVQQFGCESEARHTLITSLRKSLQPIGISIPDGRKTAGHYVLTDTSAKA